MENENAIVVVTGRGMVSSLGSNVVTSCSAACAGLSRCGDLDLSLVSPPTGEATPVRGHAAGELTGGFEGFARLLRLTTFALADLQKQDPRALSASPRVGAYLSVPDPARVSTGIDIIADDESRARRAEEASRIEQEQPADVASRLLETAATLAELPILPPLRFATFAGHAGVAECFERAVADVVSGKVQAAIVGGVDSLLDEETLVWLDTLGRLKRLGVPVGLLPGEAGAFLVLETLRSAKARGARILGTFRAVCLGKEEACLLSGAPAHGTAMTRVLERISGPAGLLGSSPPWVLCDLNGETHRSTEWGHVLVRLAAQFPAFGAPSVWYPAMSFGDVGAASGAVAVSMALHAMERTMAPSRTAIVLSTSDGPGRGAVVLQAPSSPGSVRA